MNELADRIIGHYERHARDWDADRRNAGWNDKPWHDRFIAELPAGATVLDLAAGQDRRSPSTWWNADFM